MQRTCRPMMKLVTTDLLVLYAIIRLGALKTRWSAQLSEELRQKCEIEATRNIASSKQFCKCQNPHDHPWIVGEYVKQTVPVVLSNAGPNFTREIEYRINKFRFKRFLYLRRTRKSPAPSFTRSFIKWKLGTSIQLTAYTNVWTHFGKATVFLMI